MTDVPPPSPPPTPDGSSSQSDFVTPIITGGPGKMGKGRWRLIGGLIAIAVPLVGVVMLAVLSGGDGKKATTTTTTTSTSTTTTSSSTTTTTLHPRKRYVEMKHDDRGAGLPLGTEIRSMSYVTQPSETPKAGGRAYFWTRDSKGDMLWIGRIDSFSTTDASSRFTVLQVFDVTVPAGGTMCLGWCAEKGNPSNISVVAVFDKDLKPVKAWRVDVTKLTMTSIAAEGWLPWADEPALDQPAPPRPDLYFYVTRIAGEERAQLTSSEGIVVAGTGNTVQRTQLTEVHDNKERKATLVWNTDDFTHLATLVTDQIDGASFAWGGASDETAIFRYKGTKDASIVAFVSYEDQTVTEIHRAWRLDLPNKRFVPVDVDDVRPLE